MDKKSRIVFSIIKNGAGVSTRESKGFISGLLIISLLKSYCFTKKT